MDLAIGLIQKQVFGEAKYVWLSYEAENEYAKNLLNMILKKLMKCVVMKL